VPDCVPAFVMEVIQQCAVNYNFFFRGNEEKFLIGSAKFFSIIHFTEGYRAQTNSVKTTIPFSSPAIKALQN